MPGRYYKSAGHIRSQSPDDIIPIYNIVVRRFIKCMVLTLSDQFFARECVVYYDFFSDFSSEHAALIAVDLRLYIDEVF